MLDQIMNLLKEEDGQGMVEYGIILALVAVVSIAVLTQVGQKTEKVFTKVDGELDGVLGTGGGGGN